MDDDMTTRDFPQCLLNFQIRLLEKRAYLDCQPHELPAGTPQPFIRGHGVFQGDLESRLLRRAGQPRAQVPLLPTVLLEEVQRITAEGERWKK